MVTHHCFTRPCPACIGSAGAGTITATIRSTWPPEGYELVPGHCPNATPDGSRPCNCIGACRPTLRRKSDDAA